MAEHASLLEDDDVVLLYLHLLVACKIKFVVPRQTSESLFGAEHTYSGVSAFVL